ncbi:serine/threonine-protein phosphatase [Nocardioides sp. GY 10113]|uniref:PP2C family protein-serine/threonine phosphatase n=1 Tax=Nocardioides sp. GY 10113 TaxID=2569761 RepID=UPI0010A8C1D9|nr:protein phosphatase 2C domain-containing protein [Nocardioides sp. GY 10113]TIC81264.1 serine/threonine-protein phosphatase [Nocardioides sp. GY 10113]
MLQFRYEAVSDTGRVRENNEDGGFASPYLLCVADGVGGAAAGEVASATTAYVLSARALAHPGLDPRRLLTHAAQEAHEQLAAGVRADPRRVGMATTLTAVLTNGREVALAQVGDSRAYLLRDGRLTRLTHDQTLVQEMVDAGRITPAEAATSPYRHVVMQAVGADHEPSPEVVLLDLEAGDRLLLCSDGLTDVLPDATLATLLGIEHRATAAAHLTRAALDAGSRDNVTVVVADVVDAPAVVGTGVPLGAARDLANVVDPTAVRPLRTA